MSIEWDSLKLAGNELKISIEDLGLATENIRKCFRRAGFRLQTRNGKI